MYRVRSYETNLRTPRCDDWTGAAGGAREGTALEIEGGGGGGPGIRKDDVVGGGLTTRGLGAGGGAAAAGVGTIEEDLNGWMTISATRTPERSVFYPYALCRATTRVF